MTKYSFVLLSEQTKDFLQKLQDLGMVDINRQEKAVDEHSKEMTNQLVRITQTVGRLKQVAKEKAQKEVLPFEGDGSSLLDEATRLFTEKETLRNEINVLKEHIDQAEPWGSFTQEDLDKLRNMGLTIHAYVQPVKKITAALEEKFPLHIVNRVDGQAYFIVLEVEGESYDFPGNEVSFPSVSYDKLQERLQEKETAFASTVSRLEALSDHTGLLKNHAAEISTHLDLYLANAAARKEVEDHIDLLTGFVPTEKTKELEAFLNSQSLYYISAPAESEDNPPIKLKNNWYTRLFEPIGDLYMLPRYDELDLTPYFAPFYMLFFGFCLGDMGYGVVFMILGLLGKRFLPKMKGYLNLIFFLGLGSFVMAAFPGVVFGVKIADVIPAVRENNTFLFNFSDMKMFWFAILFGLFQIVFARILTGIDSFIRKGWQHGMAPFGWAILIVWCTIAYASMEVPSLALPKPVSLTMIIVSVALILFFSKPEGPVYKRLGKGLWAMYDITGVFGDMLSYIRLFGLGTAGAILGMVFNSIAMSLSGVPYVGWLLTVIMLLFGHTLVLALNSLGAFVHPLRLTFVEFYKNAGFTGGGRGYKPLTSLTNKKEQ
ncbi:MAG TPA: V-type ATPase 116kDa subunit family protein [Bacteroidales bacterium]|nr:V-type ATPase 116kDa subunit family protein [Bacteroidales bacterium]